MVYFEFSVFDHMVENVDLIFFLFLFEIILIPRINKVKSVDGMNISCREINAKMNGDELKTRCVVNSSIMEGNNLWNWVLYSGLKLRKEKHQKKTKKKQNKEVRRNKCFRGGTRFLKWKMNWVEVIFSLQEIRRTLSCCWVASKYMLLY